MQNEIKPLTGLRGVAACVVAVAHLDFMGWFRFLAFHNLAVDLFFCLSAFTLCLVYRPFSKTRLDMRAYGVARFARVYPLYFFYFVVAATTYIRWNSDGFSTYPGSATLDFATQLFMLNALPIVGNGVHWNTPSWSLSVEALCYVAVFPYLFRGTRRMATWPQWVRILLLLAFTSAAYYMFARHFDWRILIAGASTDDPLVYWTALVRAVCSFCAGWLIYIAWQKRELLPRFAAANTDVLTVAVCLVLVGRYVGWAVEGGLVFIWPLLIVGLMSDDSWTARVLSCRPVVWLGHLSYSIYLCHLPVAHMTLGAWPALATSQPLRFGVQLAATLVVASVTYYLFECPLRNAIRRAFSGHHAASRMSRSTEGKISH